MYSSIACATLAITTIHFTTIVLGSSEPCICGLSNNPKTKINKGVEAFPNEFPWLVALTDEYRDHFCGGTLISSQYVLTAGHCVAKKNRNKIYVLLGVHNYRTEKGLFLKASEVFVHPNFTLTSVLANDIAIVKLNRSIKFSSTITPPCFPRPAQNYVGRIVTTAGWGLTEKVSFLSKVVKVDLPIVPLQDCRNTSGGQRVQSSKLCLGFTEMEKGPCLGDSGGPVMILNKKQWNLIGIVSLVAMRCGTLLIPSTRVDYYYEWINSVAMKSKFCPRD